MKIALTIISVVFALTGKAQQVSDFELVDQFKMNEIQVKVFFKDPLKSILKDSPNFDSQNSQDKYEQLETHLHDNVLYLFQTTDTQGLVKSYLLEGDPKKGRTRNYFNLKIINKDILQPSGIYDSTKDKTINRLNLGGTFFENMFIFQTKEGKKVIGKVINMWGFFTKIEAYSTVKEAVSNIIGKDISTLALRYRIF